MKQKKQYILALDSGTTSTRAIIFDESGGIVGLASKEFTQIYPQAGWVEHNPNEIFGSAVGVISQVLAECGLSVNSIAAIGITNQRETTIVWDKDSGAPVYNAIVWQCRRTAQYCNALKADGYEKFIYNKTGLMPDAYFSATKLKWILDNVPNVRARAEKGELLFGTVDTYLMWQLSGGKIFATDRTNASRTMLYNIHRLEWDDDLLKMFNIPRSMMCEVLPSSAMFGCSSKSVLGAEVPITGVAGDQQASLFGQGCLSGGTVKNTYGTGCFLLMNTGEKPVVSTHGLITTLAATANGGVQYALEGSVFSAGAAVQWLRDEMRLIKSASDSERYCLAVPDTGGVYMVPAFVGLGAPHWDSDCRGMICGITRGTKKEHIIRAVLESIAYQTFDLLHAMQRDTGLEIPFLRVDGGASANNFLMQFQADVIGTKAVRPRVLESTALGAALLAGLNIGYYTNAACSALYGSTSKVFVPNMDCERRNKLLEGWATAVGRTRYK